MSKANSLNASDAAHEITIEDVHMMDISPNHITIEGISEGHFSGEPICELNVQEAPRDALSDQNDTTDEEMALEVSEDESDDDGETRKWLLDLDAKGPGGPMPDKSSMLKMFRYVSDGIVECTFCFRKLKFASLRQHLRTHSGARPFPCPECGVQFTRRSDVTRHMRNMHVAPSAFKCESCPKSFSKKSSLISHLLNHNRSSFYKCSVCGYKFSKKEYYDSHVRYVHPQGEQVAQETKVNRECEKQLAKLTVQKPSTADHVTLSPKGSIQITSQSSRLSKEDIVSDAIDMAVTQARDVVSGIQNVPMGLVSLPRVDFASDKTVEVHIRVVIDSHIHRFVVKVPPHKKIDATTPEGLQLITNMINYVCDDMGPLDGPVEVTLKQTVG